MTLWRRLARLVIPPRRTLAAALLLLMPLVAGAAVVAYVAGPAVTLAFLIGIVARVPAATTPRPAPYEWGRGLSSWPRRSWGR